MASSRSDFGLGILLFSCSIIGVSPEEIHAGPVFLPLGDLPGGSSYFSRANAASADGSTVVGMSRSASGLEAFRWTLDEGMVGLGDLPGGLFRSEALDVSADGTIIVGTARSADRSRTEGFRWEDDFMSDVGTFDAGWSSSYPSAISADGSTIAGGGTSPIGFQAFVWTVTGGLVGLGDLPGGEFQSDANDVSADGSVVVGNSQTGNGDGEAFHWSPQTGMVGLGFLPGGGSFSSASAVSADGTVIIGVSDSAAGSQAFWWLQNAGMLALGDFAALAMSGDASLIVGLERSEYVSRAVIWDEAHGVRDLQDLLSNDIGLDLSGWTLEEAVDISADGTVIVGNGINPFGQTEGWVAVIPEPGTLMLLGFGTLLLAGRRGCAHSGRYGGLVKSDAIKSTPYQRLPIRSK